MPFNLSEAMGYGKIVSKLDTDEIVKIPLDKLDASEKNFFHVEDVQDLMESIQLVGLLDPLVVVPVGDRYRILAGHRRKKALEELAKTDKQYAAASCIILPEMSKDLEMVTLIQSNTTARELTNYEKAEAAQRLKKHLVELKKQGVKIPGRLRDIVAEQMQISATEVARMEVINKNLSDDWKPFWKENKITAYCAYEIAKLSPEDQAELFQRPRDSRIDRMDVNTIERFKLEQKCKKWMNSNCPHPLGWSDSELARRGEPVPCRNLEKILSHRSLANNKTDNCTGCCGTCESMTICKDACSQARSFTYSQRKKEERAQKYDVTKEQQIPKPVQEPNDKADPSEIAANEAFDNSPLANISKNLRLIMEKYHYSEWIIAQRWNISIEALVGQWFDDEEEGYGERDVINVLEASEASDLFYAIPEFLALCQAAETTPDRLLGLPEPSSPAGWHDFKTQKPADGQKVVTMRATERGTFYSEYIYKQENGEDAWYFSDLPDTKANARNVVAWIEPPDV